MADDIEPASEPVCKRANPAIPPARTDRLRQIATGSFDINISINK